MTLYKKPLVPNYLYASRVKDEDVAYFEQQYFSNVDLYGADVRDTPERFEYAKRMGYTFFADLKKTAETADPVIKQLKERCSQLGGKGFEWTYIPDLINENSVVYAFGVGTDISFEVALAHAHNCPVHTFDPTPQAIEYAVKIAKEDPLIQFYPYGILGKDTMIKFYKPRDYGLGSLSVANLHFGNTYIEAPVMRLTTIANQLKHKSIDLLKFDVEGAEYDVIDDLLFTGFPVKQVAMEFDQPTPPWKTERFIGKLQGGGYRLVDVTGLNCLFVHQSVLENAD